MLIKICRFSLVFLFFIGTEAVAYTKIILPETALESPATNWAASDDATINVNIGFNFPFGSAGNLSSIWINSNGGLASSSWSHYSNGPLPKSSPTSIIAPYWDDIYRRSGTIKYGTLGSAPNRHFVVAWTNTPRYSNSGSCTFQVVLYENGDIRFRYSTASQQCNGSSATVGIQESTSTFNQHSYNSVIDLSKDILYKANVDPEISLAKTLITLSDPVNGTSNPKAIPNAVLEYTLKAINSGAGPADSNSIVLSDAIPSNTSLYVNDISGAGTGPVRFVDGTPSSGLTYSFVSLSSTTDDLSFSNNNGSTFNYSPSADADGVDSSVTNVKMKTQGTFAGSSGVSNPNFEFKFRVIVK